MLDGSALFLNTRAAFIDWAPNRRRRLHVGGSLGLIARSSLDADYHTVATGWGVTAAGQAGYDRRLSPRWSIGFVAALAVYRCWTIEAGVASVSDGLLPSLSLASRSDDSRLLPGVVGLARCHRTIPPGTSSPVFRRVRAGLGRLDESRESLR